MSGNAPVEKIGGSRERGPWPKKVQEIAEGKAYNRPVALSDGTQEKRSVQVTAVNDILDATGEPTDGYVVAFEFDDPTLGGVI